MLYFAWVLQLRPINTDLSTKVSECWRAAKYFVGGKRISTCDRIIVIMWEIIKRFHTWNEEKKKSKDPLEGGLCFSDTSKPENIFSAINEIKFSTHNWNDHCIRGRWWLFYLKAQCVTFKGMYLHLMEEKISMYFWLDKLTKNKLRIFFFHSLIMSFYIYIKNRLTAPPCHTAAWTVKTELKGPMFNNMTIRCY